MNISLTNLPKISFRATTNAQAQQTQSASQGLLSQSAQDVFEKTDNKQEKNPKYVTTDIFYINDNHGRIGNMSRIYSAKELYDFQTKNSKADKLVLAAGDISAGADHKVAKAANTYMNGLGVEATSDGNHEYDENPPELAESKRGAKFKSLGMNLQIPKGNPLDGVIEKSFVLEKNGHKYAIIGLAPPDLHERIRDNDSRKQIGVDDFEKTFKLQLMITKNKELIRL